jgi:hypothetical protein
MANLFKGTLGEISPSRFFHLVNLTKKTGTYHLYQKTSMPGNPRTADGKPILKEVIRISFERGALIYAATTGSESRLLPVLYKTGKINQQQFDTFQPKTNTLDDKALALLLINGNHLTQSDIVHSMQQHMLDIVFSVMTPTEEQFSFEEGELPPIGAITIWVDIENVVADGSRRMRMLDELRRLVPSLDAVLRFPLVPSSKVKTFELTQDEWHVLSLVNSKNSINELARACHMTEIEIRRVVNTLMNAGLVEIVGDPSPKVEVSAEGNVAKGLLQKIWSRPRSETSL